MSAVTSAPATYPLEEARSIVLSAAVDLGSMIACSEFETPWAGLALDVLQAVFAVGIDGLPSSANRPATIEGLDGNLLDAVQRCAEFQLEDYRAGYLDALADPDDDGRGPAAYAADVARAELVLANIGAVRQRRRTEARS